MPTPSTRQVIANCPVTLSQFNAIWDNLRPIDGEGRRGNSWSIAPDARFTTFHRPPSTRVPNETWGFTLTRVGAILERCGFREQVDAMKGAVLLNLLLNTGQPSGTLNSTTILRHYVDAFNSVGRGNNTIARFDQTPDVIEAAIAAGVFDHYSRPVADTVRLWTPILLPNFIYNTPARVRNAYREAWSGLKSTTINRRIALLNLVIEHFNSTQVVTKMDTIPALPESSQKLTWFTPEQTNTILDRGNTIDPVFGVWLRFMLYTGCRVSEAFNLRWQDIEIDKLHLWNTKGGPGNARTLPMVKSGMNLLHFGEKSGRREKLAGPFSDFTNNRVQYLWTKLRGQMRLPNDTSPHTLRHTCASVMVQNKVPLAVIKEWLGHSSIKTTMRYAHIEPSKQLEEASAVMGQMVMSTPSTPVTTPVEWLWLPPDTQREVVPQPSLRESREAYRSSQVNALVQNGGYPMGTVAATNTNTRVECEPCNHPLPSPPQTPVVHTAPPLEWWDVSRDPDDVLAASTRPCTCVFCRYGRGEISANQFAEYGDRWRNVRRMEPRELERVYDPNAADPSL